MQATPSVDSPCRQCGAPVPQAHRFCPFCGTDQTREALGPGAIVDGRYRVERRIAAGGMAEIYLARQLTVGREVALKVLFPEHTRDLAAAERFRREAKAASHLNHPNTVTVHDFGQTGDGRLYLAMEYLQGQDLAALLAGDEAVGWRRLCDLFVQICASLHDAHERGVVHRDLKPENVMVVRTSDGRERIKVIDFGIASLAPDPIERGKEQFFGTAEFIAPELLLGGEAGPASDIYSLGVMLYEAVTGRLPYDVRGVDELLQAHVFSTPLPFRALKTRPVGVPAEVEALVMAMLAKAPDRRPASMHAVARVIAAARAATTLAPAAGEPLAPTLGDADDSPAVRRLLERLNQSTGFPAFAAHVAAINRVCNDPDASAHDLADAVRRDFGVTERLLRLVNSTFYRQHNSAVTSVHRAVVVLGFEQVRRAALSLMFWSLVEGERRGAQIEATLTALSSGLVARSLAEDLRGLDPEEVFVCALFHDLGRQLTLHYLPNDWAHLRALMSHDGMTEGDAARQVFGKDLAALGADLAVRLGMPESVVAAMRPLTDAQRAAPGSPAERRHALVLLAHGLVDRFTISDPLRRQAALRALVERHGGPLGLSADRCSDALLQASATLAEEWADLDLDLGESRLYLAMQRAGDDAPDLLRLALERVRHAHDRGAAVEAVVQQALAGFVDGARFARAVFCLKSFNDGALSARMGAGADAGGLMAAFRFPVDGPPNLLRGAFAEGRDLVVEDTRLASVRDRLPAWYVRDVAGAAFVLYPVCVRGTAVGAFYADETRARSDPPWLDPERRRDLAAMRDLVQSALRRVGGAPQPG